MAEQWAACVVLLEVERCKYTIENNVTGCPFVVSADSYDEALKKANVTAAALFPIGKLHETLERTKSVAFVNPIPMPRCEITDPMTASR